MLWMYREDTGVFHAMPEPGDTTRMIWVEDVSFRAGPGNWAVYENTFMPATYVQTDDALQAGRLMNDNVVIHYGTLEDCLRQVDMIACVEGW